jgi:endonuclease YncB( thermonuclease family)
MSSTDFTFEKAVEILDQKIDIKRFTLFGIKTFGKIVSVHDGDTFDILFVVPLSNLTKEKSISKTKKGVCLICDAPDAPMIMRVKCRLDDIDAKELKAEGGQRAKEILEKIVMNRILRCEFRGQDKYGRQLIRLFVRSDTIDNSQFVCDKEIDLSEHLKLLQDFVK